MDERPLDVEIEDARLFAARLEVADIYGRREASLEDLAPLLALFARAWARQAQSVAKQDAKQGHLFGNEVACA